MEIVRCGGLELSKVRKELMGRVAARVVLGKDCKSTTFEVQNLHS